MELLFPPQATTVEKAHGRLEERAIQTKTFNAEDIGFPFAAQIARVDRTRTELSTGKISSETVYIITSLEPHRASPKRLLELVRGHWTIENNLHYCRDRTFDEDRSQSRNPGAAQAMATLRNIAISLANLQAYRQPTRKRSLPCSQRRFAANTHSAVRQVAFPARV